MERGVALWRRRGQIEKSRYRALIERAGWLGCMSSVRVIRLRGVLVLGRGAESLGIVGASSFMGASRMRYFFKVFEFSGVLVIVKQVKNIIATGNVCSLEKRCFYSVLFV